ncbi:hypothetical protein BC828DRAFT_384484 [Blastocladiella britannica]|nr:hypothetical protein BC828DRAFT_384484 [Blastocladiella britannica]
MDSDLLDYSNVRPEDGFFDSELMKELERAINRSPMMKSKSKQSYGASRFDINDRRNDGSVFPRIESDGDRRVSTRSEATYGGLLGIPSSTSQDGLDQGKSALDDELDAMLADMSKKTYAALAAAEMDADGVWDALDAMLQNEGSAAHSNLKYVTSRAPKPLPKMSTPVEEPAAPEVDASLAIQQYRDSHRIGEIDDKVKVLKANIVAAGAAGKSIMPNSIARGRNGGEDDDDERNRMSSRHRTGTSGSGMSQKKGSKSSHSIKHARRRKEKPAPPPKPEPDQYDYERDHSAFADDDDDLDDDLDDDPFAALAAAAAAKPQSAAPVPVPEHKDPPSKPAAHHRPPPPPRLPTPPPPPPPPKVPTPPPSPPPPPPPPKAISPVSDDTKSPPPVTPAPSSPVKYVTPKPPKPKPLPPPPPPKRPPINLMQSSKPSHEPPKTIFKAKPLPASTRVPTTPLRPKTPVVRPPAKVVLREAAEEEKAVWSVLRQQQVHFEPPVAPVGAANGGTGGAAGSGEPTSLTNNLKRVTSMAWFPGLGGQTVTVTNVLGVLGDLIRGTHNHPAAGYVGTRVEAVKMAAYVYQVFSRDIQNPAGTVVAPLVEAMHTDTEWAVRAQVAAIVPKLGVYHPELIVGLITRLADVHPMVRRAAMSSLAHFGIMTRETLEAAMTRVSLLPPKPVAAVKKKKDAFRSVLDDLYDDYCRENEIKRQASAVMVQGWLRNSTFRYSDRLAAED